MQELTEYYILLVSLLRQGGKARDNLNQEEKISALKTLEEQLSELDQLNRSVTEQSESLKQAERALELYQARIKEETESMIKERRESLQTSLKKEVRVAERRMERAVKRRNQERNKQLKQRIQDSIADDQEQIEELKSQIKELVRSEDLPAYCGTRFWHRLFMPCKVMDFVTLILLGLLFSIGLPGVIYFMIPNRQLWYAYILLPLFVLLTLYPYLYVLQNTREQHKEVLLNIRKKFQMMEEVEQEIEDITKTITESEDDSAYALEKQDDRLNLARDRMEQMRAKQSQELTDFETKTKADIVKEFKEQSQEKENELQNVIQRLSRERSLTMEMASELHLKIVDTYESELGAENLSLTRVRAMLKELDQG